ncbi:MAG TPA: S9 family peptidase [Candidatus Saccharimonadia bacterium]|nr:S9 family peptidase [Candidatus Saccharimonadia bacterium]
MAWTALTSLNLQAAGPPVAPKHPTVLSKHGEKRVDDYYWLRHKQDPAVLAYLQAENAYAAAVTKPLKPFEDTLYREMLGRIQETDLSVPCRLRGWLYYSRTEAGKQYPILCRKSAASGKTAPEHILLDVNKLAKGKSFMAVGDVALSEDDRFYAFTTDATGSCQYTLQIKDLHTDKPLPVRRQRVTSVAWAADNQTLFYTTEDKVAKRSNQLWKHVLGQKRDTLVYEEKDERFSVDVDRTRSRAYLLLSSCSDTASEVRYLPADRPNGRWRLVRKRRANIEYDVDHHGDRFYLRINDTGRNFRLVSVPIAHLTPEHWQEIVPHRTDVMLEDVDLFQHYRVLHERDQGLVQLVITDLHTGDMHRIAFDEPAYSLSGEDNWEWDTHTFRYIYESMTTPDTVYDYDMATRERILRKRRPVLGDFDPANYVTERRTARAPDGTEIPMSLVYRKGSKLDGSAPLWLEGYGAYGDPNDVCFSSKRLSLLDRGVIYAVAHIRGGGDLGKAWHDAGRMLNKMNTFTDFIAVAETLIRERYTASDRLAISGGSAGGLLMGVVTNLRPDLFKVVLTPVPFVDVLSTMLDASLPLTVGEYEEWGNPNVKQYYQYMRQYSPYDNIARQAYPAMLVKTSLHDSQVMYWEPAKYVAKLRTTKTTTTPLLLVTNMGAGHGGASGRYDYLHEIAYDFAFMLDQLGIHA